MMRRLWGSLSERGQIEEYYNIIENSQFYQGTRLVQLFLKKVKNPSRASFFGGTSLSTRLVYEPELINVFTNQGPGVNLSDMQFENIEAILNRYDATEKVIKHVIEHPLIKNLSERERSFLYIADVEDSERVRDSEGAPLPENQQPLLMGVGIPIVSHEKPIDINNCNEEIFGNIDPHQFTGSIKYFFLFKSIHKPLLGDFCTQSCGFSFMVKYRTLNGVDIRL